jgi:hypothetical protein
MALSSVVLYFFCATTAPEKSERIESKRKVRSIFIAEDIKGFLSKIRPKQKSRG